MSTRGELGNAYLIFGHKEMQYSAVDQNLEMALREVSVAEARIKACDMLSLYTTARVKPVLRCKSSQIRTTAPLAHLAARCSIEHRSQTREARARARASSCLSCRLPPWLRRMSRLNRRCALKRRARACRIQPVGCSSWTARCSSLEDALAANRTAAAFALHRGLLARPAAAGFCSSCCDRRVLGKASASFFSFPGGRGGEQPGRGRKR